MKREKKVRGKLCKNKKGHRLVRLSELYLIDKAVSFWNRNLPGAQFVQTVPAFWKNPTSEGWI